MACSSLVMSVIFVIVTATGSSKGYRIGSYSVWQKRSLTYVIDNTMLKGQMSRTVVAREVAKAFKSWSDVTNLRFTRVNYGPADIRISSHGRKTNGPNDMPFEEEYSSPAHAFPRNDGRLHFNDFIQWTSRPNKNDITKKGKVDLYTIALHEIGHILGLGHSNEPSAIMYSTKDNTKRMYLSEDDVAGIQALYGKPPE